MKFRLCSLLLLLQVTFAWVCAQESPVPISPKAGQPSPASSTKMSQPSQQMQRLLAVFSGKWIYQFKYEPNETRPNGGTSEGEAVFRPGPGGLSMLEDEAAGDTSGMSVTWWDEKAQGYRAIWCDNKIPDGCIVMARLAKWEGDQFVLGDEFIKDGKKFVFREAISDITPTSYTQTLSQGEVGKELKRLVTIHATKASEAAASPSATSK
jgi:hypothetical protein